MAMNVAKKIRWWASPGNHSQYGLW